MRGGLVLALVGVVGCAGAPKEIASPGQVAQEVEEPYERILGSFTVDPEMAILLDPVTCERLCDDEAELFGLERMVSALERRGAPRAEAAARLDWGAFLWARWEPEQAYEQLMRAHRLFAALGDVNGLAHSFEWLGYVLSESDAPEPAAEHLALAYRLYERMGNTAAAARVLRYADR